MDGRYLTRSLAVGALAAGFLVVAGCERPPFEQEQTGPRGTGMYVLDNPRILESRLDLHTAPEARPMASEDGERAGDVHENVQVLADLSDEQFWRIKEEMTDWVAGDEGCTYCHTDDLASDEKYQYRVSRDMIEMTRYLNANWADTHLTHSNEAGVTCYTCHRGEPIPPASWHSEEESGETRFMTGMGDLQLQNKISSKTAYTAFPRDALDTFLVGHEGELAIVGEGEGGLRTATTEGVSLREAYEAVGLMMHLSYSLDAGCTLCHNVSRWASWEDSPKERETAWHGIRMARDINVNWINPLIDEYPEDADVLGPTGDVGKVSCQTCHNKERRPLYGEEFLELYPELVGEPDPDFDYLQFGDLGTDLLKGVND
ncbi:photosynthetic reaction center cytochrome c subunit [Halorhodospira halochloris]|uniref:Photosynthetic reaction center cytochrome c subunit n=1 Tax=Halorhodospira halochloris TaxID=1052 RepID=A0A0X8XA82_HALHR|nr:photosynthetic reaction center cytochrome PufC [Halorhodospira halochloris]MBK1653027.1 hypothetical protein [Halorhodospira halochloris]MCG5531694.1 photosynthetic reaction center cytochrome c subunit [Halorhodospira halochloris]BAU58341.1 photosynthetic reaction center cytochrome c subunit [Halorhodospira halochloris]